MLGSADLYSLECWIISLPKRRLGCKKSGLYLRPIASTGHSDVVALARFGQTPIRYPELLRKLQDGP